MKKVSIIIPIYNAEKYLKECLASIKNQTYKNIEVLMINDGSTDNSENICKEFLSDERFNLINKENGGVSSARNVGISKSTGEYILFVDSDDWCEKDLLMKTVGDENNYDIIFFDYFKSYQDKEQKIELNLQKNIDIKKEIIVNKFIGGYLWNKIFNANIIRNENLKFSKEISYCEDLIFVIEYIKYINSLNYVREPLYHYRIRKSSISNDFNSSKNISLLKAYEILMDKYSDDEKIVESLQFNYLLSYYKLKKFISDKREVNREIISKEKMILSKKSIKEVLKFEFIKYFPSLFRKGKNIKNIKLNFYD